MDGDVGQGIAAKGGAIPSNIDEVKDFERLKAYRVRLAGLGEELSEVTRVGQRPGNPTLR